MKSTALSNEEMIMMEDLAELEKTYLTFYAYDKLFGINISNVVQIISFQPVSKIPEFPPYLNVFWAMHLGRTRYMKCPNCGKYSWNKKVLNNK